MTFNFNIAVIIVDNRYITEALAIKESIAGVIGFLVSLVAGKHLSAIQGAGNTLFGIHIYAQQVLSLISFLLTVIIILFTKIVIEKQKPMIQ